MTRALGVCSWSLQPSSPADLVEKVNSCGVRNVQLALDPIRTGEWNLKETQTLLRNANITIASGMMAMEGEDYTSLETIAATGGVLPDATWSGNFAAARANANIAKQLGLRLLTFHAGVIPHDLNDPKRTVVLDRVRAIVDVFLANDVNIALETGQEPAPEMMKALAEIGRPSLGVNFDPANMILYGQGEPFASLECFSWRILQIHMKDAKKPAVAGTWGTEVPSGTGDVNWSRMCERIETLHLNCNLMIEREAGAERVSDIRFSRRLAEYKLNFQAKLIN
ncbi:MAG: sugar phosphate isomerase/epimerase family protein [Planctomycetota bacterium]